jgi:hypothetical protein
MALTLFVAATILVEALAIVFLIRGLRATSRAACMRAVGQCAALAFGEGVAVVAGKVSALVVSFAGVAGVDPSMKAEMLSRGIDAAETFTSIGVPAILLPVAFAALLFARARRTPPAGDAEAAQRQQVRR